VLIGALGTALSATDVGGAVLVAAMDELEAAVVGLAVTGTDVPADGAVGATVSSVATVVAEVPAVVPEVELRIARAPPPTRRTAPTPTDPATRLRRRSPLGLDFSGGESRFERSPRIGRPVTGSRSRVSSAAGSSRSR
jgi:hypothetical protein